MNKYLINSALLIVDNLSTLKQTLNYLNKYNFKNLILLKKKKILIKKDLIKNFNVKIHNFSSQKFSYNILKKKISDIHINEKFLLLRTSKFINLNLFALQKIFIKNKNKLVITIHKDEKELENTEIFFIRKKLINKYDFTFKKIYTNKNYKLYFVNSDYINLNKIKNKKEIHQFFSNIYSRSIILDRDGVINVNKGYVGFKKDFVFQPGAIKAIKYLNRNSIDIFVVSNQSGIARGYFKVKNVEYLHNHLKDTLIKNSAVINKIYYSPYHKDGIIKKYKKNSNCRKPGIKLFENLIKEWDISDKSQIIMIGDQITDMQFADKAKIKSALFLGGNLYNFVKKLNLTLKKNDKRYI